MTTPDPIPPLLVERVARMMSERATGHVRLNFAQGKLVNWDVALFEKEKGVKAPSCAGKR